MSEYTEENTSEAEDDPDGYAVLAGLALNLVHLTNSLPESNPEQRSSLKRKALKMRMQMVVGGDREAVKREARLHSPSQK